MPAAPRRCSITALSYWLTLQPKVAIAKRILNLSLQRAFDNSPAQHFLAAIEDAGLPGRDRGTRLIEAHLSAPPRDQRQAGRKRRMAVTNAYLDRMALAIA